MWLCSSSSYPYYWNLPGDGFNFLNYSGFMLLSIRENPCPTRAIRSDGSRRGNFYHGWKSTMVPDILTKFFSQDAQEYPPSGFLLRRASSLSSYYPYLLMNRSYKFFNYFSNPFNVFLVSLLSASYFVNPFTNSYSLSRSMFSKSYRVAISAFVFT